ncbi:unnamed protein product [Microthlaspi erraticum]|uniref:Uncharacterized protein n=1 Tax=Microthlaspi erraticum TaxID=1685480 RepID=A0A6D2KMF9_9BRAS|nr:unnamed protein product [Microthlaspi erraticum]
MEKRIDFIHESLGNKSEVLFKQVIKLDEDIKKLREDHDRSLTYTRERGVQHPTSLPFCCKPSRRGNNRQVHEDNEEEEREYEEQLDDEDEEQSIDINASPKQSKDTPSPDPRFSPPPRSQASELPRLEVMQRPPPTEEEDTWL